MDRGPVGSGCAPSGVGFDSSAFRQASRLAWRVNRPWGRARFESGAHRKVWGSSPLLSANHGRVGSVDLLSEQLSWALVEEDLGDLIAVAAASYDPDGGLSVREHFAWFFEEEELLDAVLEGADEAIAESLGLVERAGGMSDAERKKFMDDVGVEPQMSKELIALVKQRQAEKKAADKAFDFLDLFVVFKGAQKQAKQFKKDKKKGGTGKAVAKLAGRAALAGGKAAGKLALKGARAGGKAAGKAARKGMKMVFGRWVDLSDL